jgi:hypothetical protein
MIVWTIWILPHQISSQIRLNLAFLKKIISSMKDSLSKTDVKTVLYGCRTGLVTVYVYWISQQPYILKLHEWKTKIYTVLLDISSKGLLKESSNLSWKGFARNMEECTVYQKRSNEIVPNDCLYFKRYHKGYTTQNTRIIIRIIIYYTASGPSFL